VYLWPTGEPDDRLDVSDDVVSMNGARSIEDPMGSWSITLLPRTAVGKQTPSDIRRMQQLYQKIGINCVISLGFEEDGGWGVGLVTTITRTRVTKGPKTGMSVSLSGAWMGRLLLQDNVTYASITVPEFPSFLEKVEAVVGANEPLVVAFAGAWGPPEPGQKNSRDAVPTFLGQSVADAANWILANAPSTRIPLFAKLTGGTGKPSDYIDTSFSITTWNDARIWADQLSSYQGSVWGFLQACVDLDFYEIFIEYLPEAGPMPSIHLVIRPKPYDEQGLNFAPTTEDPGISWESLRTFCNELESHVIDFDELFSEQMSYGDAQAFSLYKVTSRYDLIGNPESESEGVSYPLVDTWTLPRFGVRPMESTLALLAADVYAKVQGDSDTDGAIRSQVFEYRNRLFNWYRISHYFEGGSMTVRGRDRFRPGDPVSCPWAIPTRGTEQGLRYYCTGVSWAWSYGDHYTSTLQLCRGHNSGMITWAKFQIFATSPESNPSNFAAV
jgi:hypothetical protein